MEIVQEQKPTNYIAKLMAVSFGHFFNDFYMNLIPPILFLFVQALGLNLSQQAFIAFIITSSGSFAQPIVGYIIDKRGKPILLIISSVWIAFWMSISGIITNYYLLVFIVGIGALASALYHPLGSAVVVKLANKSRGASLSVFMTIGGFAASVSPMVAIPIVRNYGLKSLVFLMIPGIIVAIFLYLAKVQEVEINEKEIKKTQKESGKINFYSLKWISALVFISSSKTLIKSFFITFGIQIAGIVLSAYLLTNSLGTIIGGYLSDKIGSKKVFVIFNMLALLSIIIILITKGSFLVLGFLFLGITISATHTANMVMAYVLMPKNLNLATGLILGLSGGIGGLAMLVYGKIADVQGLITSSTYLLIPLIIMVLIAFLLPSEKTILNIE